MSAQPSPRIRLDEASWQAGYNAGVSGVGSSTCPPEVPDALAYTSGFLEGQAARRRARASARK
jgi:ribosome modulation factor